MGDQLLCLVKVLSISPFSEAEREAFFQGLLDTFGSPGPMPPAGGPAD